MLATEAKHAPDLPEAASSAADAAVNADPEEFNPSDPEGSTKEQPATPKLHSQSPEASAAKKLTEREEGDTLCSIFRVARSPKAFRYALRCLVWWDQANSAGLDKALIRVLRNKGDTENETLSKAIAILQRLNSKLAV
jgi:hypothetical protein